MALEPPRQNNDSKTPHESARDSDSEAVTPQRRHVLQTRKPGNRHWNRAHEVVRAQRQASALNTCPSQ